MECCLGHIPPVGTAREQSQNNQSPTISNNNNIVGTGRDLSLPIHDKKENETQHRQMVLNQYGEIVHNQMIWLEEQYPYVVLHNFIVMPNHVHAVIEIDSLLAIPVGTGRDPLFVRTGCDLSLPNEIKIKSLSQLMGAFKTTSSKMIHQAGYPLFEWQRSFHDHIIRDGKAYTNIMHYITTNAARWETDCNYRA